MRITDMNPYQLTDFLSAAHKDVEIEKHLEIMFKGATIGGFDFLSLFYATLRDSGTQVANWKVFRRALRALNLANYYQEALELDGDHAECGVLRGFSALLMSRISKLRAPDHTGDGLHLIDSFSGLSQPTPQDALAQRERPDGRMEYNYSHQQGHFGVPLEDVQSVLSEFPSIEYYKGWIPEAFNGLPEKKWAFVHIDVDLYQPTYDSLSYFVPRLVPGGIVVNDDFSSPLFPGGGEGWREYFERHDGSYAVLDSGQAVYIKP